MVNDRDYRIVYFQCGQCLKFYRGFAYQKIEDFYEIHDKKEVIAAKMAGWLPEADDKYTCHDCGIRKLAKLETYA